MEIDENPAIYFIIKGEIELYHKKSIRTNEQITISKLKVCSFKLKQKHFFHYFIHFSLER